MGETGKKILTAAVLLVMGFAVGVVMMYCNYALAPQDGPVDETAVRAGAQKYTEIMDLVDQYYIGDEVDETAVNDAMASGVIAGLGDRWSYYVSAEDYSGYQDNINNSFVGVGITIQANILEDETQQGFLVTDVTSGGPAQEVGVLPDDILIAVDGNDVSEATISEVKSLVQGPEGTTVDLTFLRDGQERTVTSERRPIVVIPAVGELLPGGAGYIRIDNFDAGCAATVQELVESLTAQGAKALVFDVRNNPGGLKIELTDLLDYLLPEGIVFHSVDYAGQEDVVMSDENCVDIPMAVLVNASSYSAAEYFACALQEYGVGIVVGEQTFGKGYYQVGMRLSDGSAVNLSIGKYYTPNGISLIDVGVTPDFEVELDEEQASLLAGHRLSYDDDPQLRTALNNVMP